jgi:hypothetical protein
MILYRAGFTYASARALEDRRIEYTGNTKRRKQIKKKTSQKITIDEQHLQNYPNQTPKPKANTLACQHPFPHTATCMPE